jgi:iron complex outermembrane receptor protein
MGSASAATMYASLDDADLASLSLEELSNIEITSVAKHGEPLSKAPASIFVITGDDIRRSGATSLPDALRLAPNLSVAQVNAGDYAISARGFNNAIGNKLLVLIDGRTVYTPLYSGVNWDSQAVMLEDVDRIEVISGPGGTLWGANAVNGVINIITRKPEDTQGALVDVGGGNRQSLVDARYGGTFGDHGYYRVYGLGADRDNTTLENGTSAHDGLKTAQAGFRANWSEGANKIDFQGDAYHGRFESVTGGTPTTSGANLLARWSRELSPDSSLEVQAYYDETARDDPLSFDDRIDQFDIEFQHSFRVLQNNNILWGGGYRYAFDDTNTHFGPQNILPESFVPAKQSLDWSNLFLQDEIALNAALTLTLGIKAESNIYTGIEYLPSARIAWQLDQNKLLWGSLSRAVRAPSRIDRDFHVDLALPKIPLIPVIEGGPNFQSETADVLEIGYRAQPTSRFSYSATAFYAYYDRLRSGQPPPAVVQNMMDGSTYGVEAWGTFQATSAWRLSAGMFGLHENLRIKAGSLDPTGPSALGNDPKWQLLAKSSLNLANNQEFDVIVRHVSPLPNPVVAAYTAVDARWGWRVRPNVELSLTVQNMFDPHHIEFGDSGTASEIDRSAFFKVSWRF